MRSTFKVFTALLIIVSLIFGMAATGGNAVFDGFTVYAAGDTIASGNCGDSLSWSLDSEGKLSITGTGKMYDWTYNYLNNTSNSPWSQYKSSIKTVKISNGVTSIGKYAFRGCTGLTSVIIPDSVTSIGSEAFWGCTGLKSVYITNLEAWCKIIFSGCFSNPLFYAHNLYLNGNLIEGHLTIPDSVTSIGGFAFCSCTGLTSVTIPDSVTSIGYEAFSYCTGLTSVTIPDSVTSIGGMAFYDCTGLRSVHISDLEAWCKITFYEVYLDEHESYCSNPLIYAHNLYLNGRLVEDLVIPDSITSISGFTFSGCTGLTSVTIPDSVTSIGYEAFCNCAGLTSVTIPDSVTSIEDGAFRDCTGLPSITIPDSVTSIGGMAFDGCTGLKSVHISDLEAWCKITFHENYSDIYDRYCTNPLVYAHDLCLNGRLVEDLVIPDSITSIGNYAFDGCTGLASVTIPDSVTSIGDHAFRGCTGLISVTIPDSVTSIGKNAFDGCTGLTSVTIPDSVTSIGAYAFRGCTGLSSVIIPDSDINICENAFYDCSKLKDVYYEGTETQWKAIELHIFFSNPPLYYTAKHYGYKQLAGDLNGDNIIDTKDLTRYMKYLSGENVIIIGNTLDVTGDKAFDARDLVRLMKIIAEEA